MFKLTRYSKNPILKADKKHKWEAAQVFNACVIYEKNVFHMFYRAVASGKRSFSGGCSSIGYATSKNGIHFKRNPQPLIKPEYLWEAWGCEDPRVTKLGDTYYIFYTAIAEAKPGEKVQPRIALATTKNFKHIKKYGIIGPDVRSKAATIFPEKINGRIMMLLAAFADSPKSSIIYTFFDNKNDLLKPSKQYWNKFQKKYKKHIILPSPITYTRGAETGAPPVRTDKGWLLVYCGPAKKRKVWPIHAALLDLKDPIKVLAYTKEPILKPEKNYELKGWVNNVTFPAGAVAVKNKLFVYYGAADKSICLATCDLNKLLDELAKL